MVYFLQHPAELTGLTVAPSLSTPKRAGVGARGSYESVRPRVSLMQYNAPCQALGKTDRLTSVGAQGGIVCR